MRIGELIKSPSKIEGVAEGRGSDIKLEVGISL